ncbi:mesoderm posterior protein 1-like [Lampris incognitus]|uniref:mesoderm posterior protein 1-like n=1 Tax=Lampris incognitus TaxID=2546036 RepID=UPI0024B4FF44|nr:mesoderm posterior protein 1-like [Lampris incognitus]
MDVNFCSPLQLQGDHSIFLYDSDTLLEKTYDPSSDPGYFSSSCSSSLSPTSSVDSFCLSPVAIPACGNEEDTLSSFIFSGLAAAGLRHETQTLPVPRSSETLTSFSTKKPRSRYPGKKRQTASEREKLRMRDLTKALHHLRTYLPASLAPAGQTLTKIETLRLTIQYISYLSAQLGLTEEELEQRRSPGSVEQTRTLSQILEDLESTCSPQEVNYDAIQTVEKACILQHGLSVGQLSSVPHSCQVCSHP